MGRYYDGDISGKFYWVQKSNDADIFGVTGTQPETLEYSFYPENISSIQSGLWTCLNALGEYKTKLDVFFATHNTYNEEIISAAIGCPIEEINPLLIQYARYDLGLKILKCVEENGQCCFTAEL